MPEIIQVTSRKFFNQLTNGEDFTLNTSDFATHLLGSIGEKQKADITFTISWKSSSSPYNQFVVDFSTNTITRQSGSFIDDGFKIGDLFDAANNDPAIVNYLAIDGGTITFIDDTTIIYSGGTEIATYTTFGYMNINGRTALTGIKLFYGICENSLPATFLSKFDNSSQGFYASGLTTSPTAATKLGLPNSWVFNDVVEVYKVSSTTYTQTFRFTHVFTVTPFFLDGEQNNIEDIIDPSYFAQNESLKYVFRADINTVLSNPNTIHSFTDDLLLGEVAYYNENFNGFLNDFSTSQLQFSSGASLSDGVLIQDETEVYFTLESSSGIFSDTNTQVVVGFFYLAPQSEYSNTVATNGQENFIFYSKLVTADASPTPVDEGIMTDISAQFIDANTIDITFFIEFTATQKARLTTGGKYCIFVITEDHTKTAVLSNKVNLIVEVNNFDLYTDVPSLMTFERKSLQWIHPLDPFVSSGFTSLRMWNEDAFITRAVARLYYSTYSGANITDITGRLIGYNTADERWFELDSYSFDLSSVQTISGVQQMAINTPRAFLLPTGDPYLNAQINMGTALLNNYQDYEIYIPWKVRYEDFIANPNVPSDFFDSAETNNNQNYKASNYKLSPDWVVGVVYDITINNGVAGVDTLYRWHFATNSLHDYDEDGNAPAEWSCVINLYRESNNALISTGSTGLILEDENTIIEAVFTPVSGAGYLLNPWAALRMEVLNSGYLSIFELSSVTGRDYLANSPLIPLDTYVKTVIVQGATEVKVYGRIDASKIDPSQTYKISARLGGIQYGGPGTETILLTEAGDTSISEGGKIMLTEEPI